MIVDLTSTGIQNASVPVIPATQAASIPQQGDNLRPVWVRENGEWQQRQHLLSGYLEAAELEIGIFSVWVFPADIFSSHLPDAAEFAFLVHVQIGSVGGTELFGLKNIIELLALFDELSGER